MFWRRWPLAARIALWFVLTLITTFIVFNLWVSLYPTTQVGGPLQR
jgi:hypothetical protein